VSAGLADMVLELHAKGAMPYTLTQRCTECGQVYPCRTVLALNEATHS
jgi:hypothetical protein